MAQIQAAAAASTPTSTSTSSSPKLTKNKQLSLLFQLFWTFFRISPMTFGGGYAMIPLIEREVVTKRGWIQEEEMGDILSISGSAPGGVGVNASAYIGFRMAGIAGAVAAIVGITLPTFLIVFVLSFLYGQFSDNAKFAAALQGIQGAVIALILVAAYRMGKSSLFDKATVSIALIALTVLLFTKVHPLFAILAGIVAGMAVVKVKMLLGWKVQTEKQAKGKPVEETYYPEYYI
ncbi:chromate transporter [Paenibacillus sp. GCM10027626]|uniref:chromate transporter n=1 Tax=Paenibacillus sp. GCM10027626 TaxID=3273411 RepID=UPI00362550F6